jgi:AraC-like DNA-binding protein
MDVLSDVLRSVRLCGSAFFTAEFSSPWALDSPNPDLLATVVMPEAEHVSLFHVLMEGQCLLECERHPRVEMESGDVVVFPHGHAHTMRSEDAAPSTSLHHVLSRPSADALPHVSLGGGGRRTRFICGYLNCNQRFAPLFEALPSVLVVRRRTDYGTVEAIDGTPREPADVPQESSTWLATTLKFTVNEAVAARPGNAAMLGRLTELMFVEIVREYMQQLNPRERGWLAALRDPSVGKALRLLHESPMRPWTVDLLAHDVAISRSGLAQRFTRLLGESPMKYLSEWRIHLAKQMLRDRDDNIQNIAERIGYESQFAFNRAFKKATGSPPAVWRRAAGHISRED